MVEEQKRICRSASNGISSDMSDESGGDKSMSTLGDIFGSSFYGNNNVSREPSTRNYGNESTGGNVLATNLTPTNNGIALQSNLLDAIKELPTERGQHRPFFFSNSTNGNKRNYSSGETSPDDVVSDLNRMVNSLSITERQEAQNDLFGFRLHNHQEDPTELGAWLHEMDEFISKGISGNDNRFSALQLAMHTNATVSDTMGIIGNVTRCHAEMTGGEYVRSQRLRFLRASAWKPEEAVLRMACFFQLKLEHFGSESLTRELTLQDLTKEDLELWKRTGFCQLAQERDAYGRAILLIFGTHQLSVPLGTVIRVLLYMSMIMNRDETIQLMGNCQIYWGLGISKYGDKGRIKQIVDTFKGLPLRGVARHICYDNPKTRMVFNILAQGMMAWGAVRLRVHHGTAMECAYNLMTYGISRDAIPVNNDGEIDCEFHRSFLEVIARKEADDEKRRRQERLDRQIKQLQQFNQTYFCNNQDNGQGGLGRRGEPYQREPPVISLQEDNNEIEQSFTSRLNSSGMSMSGLDPLSLRSDNFEDLPEDFMNRLAHIANSTTSTNSAEAVNQLLEPFQTYSGAQNDLFPSDVASSNPTSMTPSDNAIGNAIAYSANEQRSGDKTDELIVVPGVLDVIMGRGRHNKKKPGNRKLNQLLESYRDEYEANDKFQKTVLAEVVVSKMIEEGSRFLVREGEKKYGVWVEVSLDKARDKVAHDFRNLRRNAKLAKGETNDPSAESAQKRRLSL